MALAGDHVQVLIDGYELTGDSNRLRVDDQRTLHDVTTFGDGVHHFVPGQQMSRVDHEGYLNSMAARSHPVLKANNLSGVVSVLLGQNTAPVVGDPAYSLVTIQTQYSAMPEIARAIPFKASFANRGASSGWGIALAVPITITNSSNGSVVDQGVATTLGGAGYLHLLQAAGSDTYVFEIEGSATGAFASEETTLAAFTLDASTLASERIAIPVSIPRYVRWKATRSGASGDPVTFALNFVRF